VPTMEERVRLWCICDGGVPLQVLYFNSFITGEGKGNLIRNYFRGPAPVRMG
jgi:hypothetical protein